MDIGLEEQAELGESYILEDLPGKFTIPSALFISYSAQVLDFYTLTVFLTEGPILGK